MKKLVLVFCLVAVSLLTKCTSVNAEPNTYHSRRINTNSTMYVTTPVHNDTSAAGDTLYNDSTGLTFSSGDYDPSAYIHGVFLGAGSGDIGIKFEGGGTMKVTVTVSSGSVLELFRGYRIDLIDSSRTTFSGPIFPLF